MEGQRVFPKRTFLSFPIGVLFGIMSCSTLPMDRSVSAAEGNAATLFLSGCGEAPRKSNVFCEVRETAQPSQEVTLHFPEVKCKRDHCIKVQLTRLDGSFGEAFSLEKGGTKLKIPLSKVVGSDDPVSLSADGEYQAGVKLYFIGPDGEEYVRNMRGFIRISVLRSDYIPVACNDPLIAWDTKLEEDKKGCHAQWTTQLRSALCGSCGGG